MKVATEIEEAAKNKDQRHALGGWAPGEYLNRCPQCGKGFTGDKRAYQCADCAYGEPGERHKKKLRYRLSPELGDGDGCTFVATKEDALAAVEAWFDEKLAGNGEGFSVKLVAMSDHEFEMLPEL